MNTPEEIERLLTAEAFAVRKHNQAPSARKLIDARKAIGTAERDYITRQAKALGIELAGTLKDN